MNYYIISLLSTQDGLVCHNIIALFSDMVLAGVAMYAFIKGKALSSSSLWCNDRSVCV